MKLRQSHAVVIVAMGCGFAAPLASASVASPASTATLPVCLPPVAIANAHVARIEGNGVLALSSGQTLRLEGLLWPTNVEGAPRRLLSQTAALLRDMTRGALTLRLQFPKLDRYGRLRAQAFSGDGRWLQREMLLRGLARVSLSPDRRECAAELHAAEMKARAAHAGLWAIAVYRVRDPASLRWQDLGSFQIVEGRVLSAKVTGGRAYLNFGRDWRTDFTATISPEDMKTFRHATVDPYRYAGKSVRVRGYVERMNGFEIEVPSPEAIEILKQ